MWRALEPVHAVAYFAPESQAACEELGTRGLLDELLRAAGRAAGRGPAELVTALFYNFHPGLVARAVPDVWSVAPPERFLAVRLEAVDAALRRLLGADVLGRPRWPRPPRSPARPRWPRRPPGGRWPRPTPRWTGPIRRTSCSGTPRRCCASTAATGTSPRCSPPASIPSRRWCSSPPTTPWTPTGCAPAAAGREEEWAAAVARLAERGLLDADGALTAAGRALRAAVEERTDELADALGGGRRRARSAAGRAGGAARAGDRGRRRVPARQPDGPAAAGDAVTGPRCAGQTGAATVAPRARACQDGGRVPSRSPPGGPDRRAVPRHGRRGRPRRPEGPLRGSRRTARAPAAGGRGMPPPPPGSWSSTSPRRRSRPRCWSARSRCRSSSTCGPSGAARASSSRRCWSASRRPVRARGSWPRSTSTRTRGSRRRSACSRSRWWSPSSAASRCSVQRRAARAAGPPDHRLDDRALRDRMPGIARRRGRGRRRRRVPVEEEPEDPRFTAAEDALERGDYAAPRRPTRRSSPPSRRTSRPPRHCRRSGSSPAPRTPTRRRSRAPTPRPTTSTPSSRAADAEVAVDRVDAAFARLVAAVARTGGDDRDRVREHLVGLFELFPADDPRVATARRALARALFCPGVVSGREERAAVGVGYRGRSCPTSARPLAVVPVPVSVVAAGGTVSRHCSCSPAWPSPSRCTCVPARGWSPCCPRRTCTSCTSTSTPSGRRPSRSTQGGDIYDTPAKLRNLNPPLLAVLLAPFALLDALPAYRLFVVLTLIMVVGAVLVVARELRLTARVTAAVVLVVLASSPLHGTLLLGQIYGLLLVGLVAGWVAERRGHPLLAAACYGVTVALKPSLAPLLLLPLALRRWRPAAAGFGARPRRRCSACWSPARRAGCSGCGSASASRCPTPRTTPRCRAWPCGSGCRPRSGRCSAWPCWPARWPCCAGGAAQVDPAGTAPWAVLAAGLLMSPIAWHNYLMLLWPGVLLLLARGAETRRTPTGPAGPRCCSPWRWCRCRGTRCGRPGSGGRSPAGSVLRRAAGLLVGAALVARRARPGRPGRPAGWPRASPPPMRRRRRRPSR